MPPVPKVVGLLQPFAVGRGLTEIVKPASPAVASGFTYLARGKYWDRVVSLDFKLVADANAANRVVTVAWQDADSREFARVASPFNQTATVTTQYCFALGIQQFGANAAAAIGAGIPGIFLQPEWKLVVTIANVQAGDQVSLISLLLDRFPTGMGGYEMGAYQVEEASNGVAAIV